VGINGAAVSALISQMLISLSATAVLLVRTRTRLRTGRVILGPAFASLLCAVSARLVFDIFQRYTFIKLGERPMYLSALVTGTFIYILTLWLMNILPRKAIKVYFLKKFRKNY
jgi:hypothetical protein